MENHFCVKIWYFAHPLQMRKHFGIRIRYLSQLHSFHFGMKIPYLIRPQQMKTNIPSLQRLNTSSVFHITLTPNEIPLLYEHRKSNSPTINENKHSFIHSKEKIFDIISPPTSPPNMRQKDIDGLMQERHNSNPYALELCLSCTNPLIWYLLSPSSPQQ